MDLKKKAHTPAYAKTATSKKKSKSGCKAKGPMKRGKRK
jgi:hypothetical protein